MNDLGRVSTPSQGTKGVVLLLVCLAGVATRLPALRYGALSDDEAIYATMAKEVLAGGVMYRDVVDHKPPGLTYTYAAVRAVTGDRGVWGGVHLLGLLAVLGTMVALFGIGRQLLQDKGLAPLPPLLYALATAGKQPVDALAVNGELLMNLPLSLAVWIALADRGGRARRLASDLAVGALVAVAALYKYQASVAGAALVFLVDRRAPLRPAAWLLGYAAPFVVTTVWFAHHGALQDAVTWGLRFNGRYLAAGPSLRNVLERLALQLVGVVVPSLVIYTAGLSAVGRRPARPASPEMARGARFVRGWAVASLLCVTLGGRFFGHYFLQAELPLALLAAEPIARWFRRAPRTVVVGLALPPLLFSLVAASPSLSARLFERGAPDYAAIASAVRRRTTPDQSIWVWGNAPQIYTASDRRAGTRFVFCNYLTGLSPATPSESDPAVDPGADAVAEAWAPLIADLDRRRPALVLDTAEAGVKSYGKFPIRRYPVLADYLRTHYRRDGTVAGLAIYRRSE